VGNSARFVNQSDADPRLFSYGHRNIQGLALHPQTQQVWSTEHGARGGDELNLIRAGQNFGWPLVTHSREYFGPEISPHRTLAGMIDPVLVWQNTIAPSGLAWHNGKLYAGGLVSQDNELPHRIGGWSFRLFICSSCFIAQQDCEVALRHPRLTRLSS